MRTLAPLPSRFLLGAMLSCLMLAGCSTPGVRHPQADAGPARLPELPQPHLLYLLPSPHTRLYVEVDAVEGCEPKDIALQNLKEFLAARCDKPDGIEVVRSDVIPAGAARGSSPRALARQYIDGSGTTNAPPPAFMYVLYYARFPGTANPYAETYPYPAIYFNARFSLGIAMNEILLHETGHLLGLVNRPAHARKGHCRNRGCQMNTHLAYLRQFRWLPGRKQSPLCAECVRELGQSAAQMPLPSLRYIGPALVRSEVDYHVVMLPDRVGIVAGQLTEEDCKNFAVAVRKEHGGDDWLRVHCLVKDNMLQEPAKLNEILRRFGDDPFDPIRHSGRKALLETCLARYVAANQYSNAVALLRQAILLDDKDDWSYHHLARIKATCPDASVRNGDEAVSAATKACALTAWKNRQCIGTLAAAHAEAGDFERAIKFQKQALRTGEAPKAEQKAMRERLLLYEQSKPFRTIE